jgi:hypothetical protein
MSQIVQDTLMLKDIIAYLKFQWDHHTSYILSGNSTLWGSSR